MTLRYLGNGVYASLDGYQVWLYTRTQRCVLALEMLVELDRFREERGV